MFIKAETCPSKSSLCEFILHGTVAVVVAVVFTSKTVPGSADVTRTPSVITSQPPKKGFTKPLRKTVSVHKPWNVLIILELVQYPSKSEDDTRRALSSSSPGRSPHEPRKSLRLITLGGTDAPPCRRPAFLHGPPAATTSTPPNTSRCSPGYARCCPIVRGVLYGYEGRSFSLEEEEAGGASRDIGADVLARGAAQLGPERSNMVANMEPTTTRDRGGGGAAGNDRLLWGSRVLHGVE